MNGTNIHPVRYVGRKTGLWPHIGGDEGKIVPERTDLIGRNYNGKDIRCLQLPKKSVTAGHRTSQIAD